MHISGFLSPGVTLGLTDTWQMFAWLLGPFISIACDGHLKFSKPLHLFSKAFLPPCLVGPFPFSLLILLAPAGSIQALLSTVSSGITQQSPPNSNAMMKTSVLWDGGEGRITLTSGMFL